MTRGTYIALDFNVSQDSHAEHIITYPGPNFLQDFLCPVVVKYEVYVPKRNSALSLHHVMQRTRVW